MVAIIRFFFPIALVVSAEAALISRSDVTCTEGTVEVDNAGLKFDAYVAKVKELIRASKKAVSGCTIRTSTTDDGRGPICEKVGTVLATEVSKTVQCKGNIYGTAAGKCNSDTIKDGTLAVKAPFECILTITRTLTDDNNGNESVDNDGEGVKNNGNEGDNNDGEGVKNNGNEGVDNDGEGVKNNGNESVDNDGEGVKNNGNEGDNNDGEGVKNNGNEGVDKSGGSGDDKNGNEGDINGGSKTEGDNTGSSGVTPALTLGCLTAVVAALK